MARTFETGNVIKLGVCYVLVTDTDNIILGSVSPRRGGMNRKDMINSYRTGTYDGCQIYPDLDSYLSEHPKSTSYLQKLFKLMEEDKAVQHMKTTSSIKDKIEALPINAEGKRAVSALIEEIMAALKAPSASTKSGPKYKVGQVLNLCSYHCLLTKKGNIILPYCTNGALSHGEILKDGYYGADQTKVAYETLDDYLKAHPMSVSKLGELFKLMEEHNK